MPTKRRKIGPYRAPLLALTDGQWEHLAWGWCMDPPGNVFPFASEEQRRASWQRHRDWILANWDPNSRPAALWEYDYGLTRVGWPKEWSWPRGVTSEAEMIRREVKAGRLR